MTFQSSNENRPVSPQRLSALYQYHNAPEVAPSHGLEYDDTVYPVSDKFPVVREGPPGFDSASTIRYTGKHAFVNDNKPPRIIFGMKVKTFLMVAAVMVLIIVERRWRWGGRQEHARESDYSVEHEHGEVSEAAHVRVRHHRAGIAHTFHWKC